MGKSFMRYKRIIVILIFRKNRGLIKISTALTYRNCSHKFRKSHIFPISNPLD